ncbi:hypothetical protein TetV_322 [Tetraselmis virus 1]|uniref:Uncharacterized protein n=1 Tax=Tetraselmis virus 1 TaxID=2060617 RepID=A0A2P0VND2_9VIRU|nr:hypothetical protein QJ968_gp322 [Tetraselmis virus 1]AUF82414.1 hypothetical protein TetV_322 [Tetraselmis virus 1]
MNSYLDVRWYHVYSIILYIWCIVARLFKPHILSPFPAAIGATAFSTLYQSLVLKEPFFWYAFSSLVIHLLCTFISPVDLTWKSIFINFILFLSFAYITDFIKIYSFYLPEMHQHMNFNNKIDLLLN